MDINILDYVDEHEIKGAILDGLSGFARSEAERVISNCGHYLATDIVNANLGENAPAQIADRVEKVLSELSSFTVFDGGGYGRPQAASRTMLDDAVRKNKDALDKAVRSAIHNLTKSEIVDIVKSGTVQLTIGGKS